VILFPRSKHRPDVYFLDGERRLLVSPAAVDIGGLIITPLEKDFLGIDARQVREIFTEVTVKSDVYSRLIEAIL
jgi:hypothetical protein